MTVIVVYIERLERVPPVISFIRTLDELGYRVVVCTVKEGSELYQDLLCGGNISTYYVSERYEGKCNLMRKFVRMKKISKTLWEAIDDEYTDESVIVAVTEVSIKHLGKKLLKKNYILYMLELLQNVYYVPRMHLFKIKIEKYARKAKAVIEAEYNRAHITRAWWGLSKIPYVLPNKPYLKMDIRKNAEITVSNLPSKFYELINKKIILYQGIINEERPLTEYYNAIQKLGSEYAFIVMGSGGDPFPDSDYCNYLYLPHITPPLHLQITSHAYIGILSYTPIKNENSILNVLYCAPNKIWEYSKFGIPVISNELPALNSQYTRFHNGICVYESEKAIYEGLIEIINNYDTYSSSAIEFYNSIDLKQECKRIFSDIVD